LDEIDTCRSFASISVKRCIRFDKESNISDVDADVVAPVLVGFDGESVIEIFGCLWVNAENTFVTEIFACFEFAFRNTMDA